MFPIRVPGFKFAGVACGIKKSRKKDLALIFSERPAAAAALFTTSAVKSPAVLAGMKRVKGGKIQAVVVNSGNANACTGARGLKDAEAMCREAARRLRIDPGLVLPSSTGLIGVPLPMEKIKTGIKRAARLVSAHSFVDAATAICTTHRFVKIAARRCSLSGKRAVVAGMGKGAGVIAPNMATMLAYILTDAAAARDCMRAILKRGAGRPLNTI